ncbi:hypothetical protein CPT_Stills22 [Bacillus phage Stills]|uniref:Uncharacterized protein n=1 Tax=Bacillus phage Stills TaxID=1610833 RepID=A0A0E3T7K2_9CAUD|nr:hypothetical protein CPT_Stills22 [Bacillus phage Stills]AKC02650.1 hypothetical protein CPT_Stills22 [Bacillus phage Stills]
MLEKFIPMFDIGEKVITDDGREGKIVGCNGDVRKRKGRQWVNEKYMVEFKDGSEKWIKVDDLELLIESDHEPVKGLDSINGLLQDCLLLSTKVPLDVRIKTIKEMQKGAEGEDLTYGL